MQKYYSIKKIEKLDAEYNIILGERSNGKSYAVKYKCLADAIKKGILFIYMRRWDLEVKRSVSIRYFNDADISKISSGKYTGIDIYNGIIYVGNPDAKTGLIKKELKVGYTIGLTAEQHFTSGIYPDVGNIIFEEFISRDYYIPKEPLRLMNLVSTIARRRKIHVWMIGNTISRLCPYFSEWQLTRIPKQKQGTIDVYPMETAEVDDDGDHIVVRVAVEYCENSGNNSKMFFGSGSKMITEGAWQSEMQPHLEKRIGAYRCDYKIVVWYDNYKFLCSFLCDHETHDLLWYVTPKTTEIEKNTRVISNHVLQDNLTTFGFIPLSKDEVLPFDMIKHGKVFYSDNLTGSDFKHILQKFGTVL